MYFCDTLFSNNSEWILYYVLYYMLLYYYILFSYICIVLIIF